MRNKRFSAVLCLLLCVVLAFAFVGCNKDDDNGDVKPADKVTVTFKNGDTVVDTVEIEKGTAVAATTKTVTAPDGKEFKSWQKDGVDYDFSAKVNEDITLVAAFKDAAPTTEKYTITFKDAAGNVLDTIEVVKGQYIAAADVPMAPDKSDEHKTFVGWVLESDPLVPLDYDSEVLTDATYVAKYETVKFTVTLTEANNVTTWEAQTVEYGGTIKALDLPLGYIIESVKNGTEDFDITAPVTSDLTLTITLKEVKYNVTFRDADGKEIATVLVPRNGNATLPTAVSNTYWTAEAEEYAKLFNVIKDCTITLGTTASDKYKNNKTWINSPDGGKTAQTMFNADFETGGWALVQPPFQKDGAYFTVTGNFAKFSARIYINKGDTCTYKIYVDGILVRTLELEASADAAYSDTVELVGPENMTAGMHTIKVESVKTAQIQVLEGLRGPDIKDNYDVIFKDAAGNEFAKVNVPSGSAVAAPATAPVKTAFLFKEWQLDGKKYDFTAPVTEDIVLTPAWDFDTANYIKVKFTVDGKQIGDELYVGKNGTVAKPTTDPTKDKHEFKFWTVDGTTEFDFSTALTADTEIKAYFEATVAKYTVTFKDAEGKDIGTVTVVEGENASLPTPPTNFYWTTTNEEYVKLFNVIADQTVTLDKVATSKYSNQTQWINSTDGGNAAKDLFNADFTTGGWKLSSPPFQDKDAYFTVTGNYANFKLRLYVNKGDTATYHIYVDGILVKVVELAATDAAINQEYVVLDATNFVAGMHTIKVVVVKTAQILAIGAQKGPDIKDNYDVIFKDAAGNEFSKASVKSGSAVTAPDTTPTLTAFLFKEWQLNGKKYDFTTPVTEDIVLTPAWEFDTANYIKVKFTADGQAFGDEQYVAKNGTATKPATDPTKENYKFKFWTVDNTTEFDFSTALTADTEIKAFFELDAKTHTVTFKDAEGTVLGTATVIDGETAQLPAAPEGYYWTCTMADLANITADKDVVLGKVDASLYPKVAANHWNITVNKTPDDQATKYSVTKSGGNDQNWGFVFYQKGSYVEFKADIAGELRFTGNCEKNGQHFVLGLYIDGVLYKTINIDTPTPFAITADANLPAGEHTYRIAILSATADEGGETPGAWAGIVWTAIGFQEKTTSTETEA